MAEVERGKLKLMVVDDESDNLDLLYRSFRREFEVFRADSGPKALQILEQIGEMGIIISDQRMPHMNGTEFLSRTVEPYPDTMRILLTGYTDVEDLVGAINQGKVFKYITKPWNPDDLERVVRQAAETYRVVKQRTNELHSALRRESILNTVMTAIRESLDYCSMLQTIVDTIGQTFASDRCVLYPVDDTKGVESILSPTAEVYCDSANTACSPTDRLSPAKNALLVALEQRQIQLITANPSQPLTQLIVPLTYQQEVLAVLVLYKQGQEHPWTTAEIQLIQGVAEQAALAISQAKLYQQIQYQTEQMQTELAVARQIQMNLLRQSWSTSTTVRVQAQCHPAREVGGDFFEVYVHPQGEVWLAVGDVSGKGVPAALFMASAISLLRRELSLETPPAPNLVLQNLNQSLSDDLVSSNCFITMVLARYHPETHELTYANAGHIYPLVWSRQRVTATVGNGGDTETIEPAYLKVRGVPLGILPIWRANAGTLNLNSGDVLLLTSDGITEATVDPSIAGGTFTQTSAQSMLQQAGLWQLLRQHQGTLNLSELLAHIRAYTPIQEDDQTLLSLEVL
ncbi:fused response regulator/phosphatase [filamentous cyanobacterium CCP1]|nr:fused response regulator/phosphatase [filamentous cyanobacterium CCP2]PSB66663.1 fused response regulator/phosphatase [filamentous cyanobacterium CCP1]